MKKLIFAFFGIIAFNTGCKKSDTTSSSNNFNTLKEAAIHDFVNKIALPGYVELKSKAAVLNNSIIQLNNNPIDANLTAARLAWKDMRVTWEKCEGFLFGPIEDNEYDPETDTWPVNYVDLDAVLNNAAQPLSITDISGFSRALKGYHPIEYILWGEGGTRTAADLTARQKEYMVSLSALLKENADNLYSDWDPAAGNYASIFLTAGNGSTVFVKKQDAFNSIVQGLMDICDEVGAGKMKEPYDLYLNNPALAIQSVESPFSGNSITDFKNNIIGAYQVYLGKFNDDGTGLEDLVKEKNSALDIEIQQKFNIAIQSFNAITLPFEEAIASQRTQCAATMLAIDDLSTSVEKLATFVATYITD